MARSISNFGIGIVLGATAVLAGAVIYAALSHANPMVPAVNTDMNCPAIVDGWPDMIGSSDGSVMSCFAAPVVLQSASANTDTSGLYTWTYPSPCNTGNPPKVWAIAQGPNPQAATNINVQLEGAPGNTTASFRVTKTTSTVVALLGLTISVAATGTGIGATPIQMFCEPQ